MRVAVLIALALVGLALRPAVARADADWVLILDNSGSMAHDSPLTFNGVKSTIPATDPDRLVVIATQIFRSFLDPTDKLTILVFNSREPGIFDVLPNTQAAVRAEQFNQGTFFVGPLKEARRILDASAGAKRTLLIFTDGAPSPENGKTIDAAGARALLGLDPGPAPFQVVSLGVSSNSLMRQIQQGFLAPLGRLESIDSPTRLVAAFTEVYADSIRSRPESGRLEPGATFTFTVNKYVSDVLVAVGTEKTTGPFQATLVADGTPVAMVESGDSGCGQPPCHAYQVFKARHDPQSVSSFSLKLERSAGPVAYGLILRYELAAEIVSAPAKARVGEEVDVVARLTWKGQTFNDAAFFAADGFTATLATGDATAPLAPRADGTFAGRIRVTGPVGPRALDVRFANRWLKLEATRPLPVTEVLPLQLVLGPVDLGAWVGERASTRRCADVDLSRSLNADRVPLEAFAEGLTGGFALEAPSPLVVSGKKTTVCVVAPGCCAPSPANVTTLVVRGVDATYHAGAARAPLTFRVAKTPFLVCWWRVISAALGALLLIFIVNGFVRPYDFDREDVVRLAKTEQALARASGRRLRDLPGGRRGFYRDARIAFDASGNATTGSRGSLILKAGKREAMLMPPSAIEEKDPRTHKFQPVALENGPSYLRRGVVYRSGDFFVRLG